MPQNINFGSLFYQNILQFVHIHFAIGCCSITMLTYTNDTAIIRMKKKILPRRGCGSSCFVQKFSIIKSFSRSKLMLKTMSHTPNFLQVILANNKLCNGFSYQIHTNRLFSVQFLTWYAVINES